MVSIIQRNTRCATCWAGPWCRKQLMQIVFAQIVVVELEQRLAGLGGQPKHGPLDQGVGPLDVAQHPRSGAAGQIAGGGLVHQDHGRRVLSQEAGRHAIGSRAFDRFFDDRCLVFAQRDQDDLAGFKNRRQPHRDRVQRHVFFAEEITGRVAPRDRIERGQPRAAVTHAERFVEADMPVATDAQQSTRRCRRPARWRLRSGGSDPRDLPAARCRRECGSVLGGMLTWLKKCSDIQR